MTSLRAQQTIRTYADLTEDRLAVMGFDRPAQALRLLQDMAGHDVPDSTYDAFLESVIDGLAVCADPDRAVANLARYADAVGNRGSTYHLLAAHRSATKMLLTIFAASQFFADILIRHPEYFELLTNPRIRDRDRGPVELWADISRRVDIAKTPNAKRDALRRCKPPEILRIGIRDVLGYADVIETTRSISDFADASLRMALRICSDEMGVADPPFAIIAMGKLGGREVNYSSDVDLIFVHDNAPATVSPGRYPDPSNEFEAIDTQGRPTPTLDPSPPAHFDPIKLAEAVRDCMARPTEAGFIFRVDLRLRPEGRFGPVSRSIEACRAYYESWAEPWERQALLKARFVAGEPEIGNAFLKIAEACSFPRRVEVSFVQSIRDNKRRVEDKIALAGEMETNVKEGRGGIRDIEFMVQILQLVAGGRNADLRTPNTPEALNRLASADLITADEHDLMMISYLFLRDVEHRLQIMHELPVRNLPTDRLELGRFGRRLGYADADSFLHDYRRHTERVHGLLLRLFYGDDPAMAIDGPQPAGRLIDRILDSTPPSPVQGEAQGEASKTHSTLQVDGHGEVSKADARAEVDNQLGSMGFKQPREAVAIIVGSVLGSEYGGIHPSARAAFLDVADALIRAASATSDPDAALRGIDALAIAVPSRSALYRTLIESHDLMPRLAALAADSPYLWQILLRHQELLDLLVDGEAMESGGYLPAELPLPRSGTPTGAKDRFEPLAQWIMRSRLRTGARDVWGLADVGDVLRETTIVGETVLRTALAVAAEEEGYLHPIAVIGMGKLGGAELGYSSDYDVLYVAEQDLTGAGRTVKKLQQLLRNGLTSQGMSIDVDARLRPDGKKGEMVLDVESYRRYWMDSAALWERQALTKARAVAGDVDLGRRFMAAAAGFVYGSGLTDEQVDAVRGMKRRIERERAHSAGDLKLGQGGLSDIEWICQMFQLRLGHRFPRLQVTNTLRALRMLRDDAHITQADWECLDATYRCLVRARNHAFLKSGVSADPVMITPELTAQMSASRSIFDGLFYGR